MCGLFGYLGEEKSEDFLRPYFERVNHRGPDYSEMREVAPAVTFGFHRLAINGLNAISNQPMERDGIFLVANAEVYNYLELADEYDCRLDTDSDCEIIIHLYQKLGIEKTVSILDAEYAFVLHDAHRNVTYASRDHLGVRGLYIGRSAFGDIGFASEAKSLVFMDELDQFPPGHYWSSSHPQEFTQWYEHDYPLHQDQSEEVILTSIRTLLTDAVKKRLMSERKVGCLLSGGLDSSLITALVAKHYDGEVETFSIGLEGSPDLAAAQLVADHLGTKHHSVQLTEDEFLAAIEDTVYQLGSSDVTTIRASVGHMLISRYVRDHSDVKVLFTGETADEMGSYLYFQNAPDASAFQDEAIRLLEDIHYFDMLRGDRSISSAGLEGRVPFSDKAFVKYYMGIEPSLRMFSDHRIEKYLIRKAFANMDLLPDEVLWRRKNGFSDSVSSKTRSWSMIIQEFVDKVVSDEEFERGATAYTHDTPKLKEGYFYRKLFTKHYGPHQHLTPYQWLPRWCGDVTDPSARVLTIYQAD
jgi:asparagine synthase (glutamine-hydrolysing)